jgi:sugar lactone lactonase YvrE
LARGVLYVADSSTIRKIGTTVAQVPLNRGVVTTIAGNGGTTFTNGTGTNATFNVPTGIAVDSVGNIYVSEQNNNRIRRITTAGVVSTLAGSGTGQFADGSGAAASFWFPYGVAVDSAGNVYVADTDNHRIRKITPGGVVTTLAGSGTGQFADGTGSAASFFYPHGIAVDSAGIVYVSDKLNHRIRRITSAGVVTTLAGSATAGSSNQTGTNATFRNPEGIAVDSAGNLYVGDRNNDLIRKITPEGVVTTLAGSTQGSVDGTGTNAMFSNPAGLALDLIGNIYVCDQSNNIVRKITPAGVVTTLAGNGGTTFANGTGTSATFNQPWGVAVDSGGIVYVADSSNHRIRKIQ